MEKLGEWERSMVINELMQGQESVKQLQMHLDPTSPIELRESLLKKIWVSLAKAISMVKANDPVGDVQVIVPTNATDSPHSFSGSPHSENSDRDLKDLERRDICKKRKLLPKWTQQVRVCNGTGLDGPLEDGYCWRKYGQKDILGARFPRSYYRCTHRHVQGCLATKQVQRSDEDPTIFEITYRGAHTCTQSSTHLMPSSSSPRKQVQHEQIQEQIQEQQAAATQQILLNFRTGLKVETEDWDTQSRNPSSFSFPSTSMGSIYANNAGKAESSMFSPSAQYNNNACGYNPSFISPTTSESNFLSVSQCRLSGYSGAPNLHNPESDLNEIISCVTSSTNSPIVDLDFATLDDPDFPFDASNFLS